MTGRNADSPAERPGATAGRTGTHHELSVEADSNVRLDLLVASRLDLSRTQSATLIANRAVTVNGKHERASYRAVAGDRIVVDIPAPPSREIWGNVSTFSFPNVIWIWSEPSAFIRQICTEPVRFDEK